MKLIEKYFPTLTEEQKRQFEALDALYHDWNEKINVISRKDIDNLYAVDFLACPWPLCFQNVSLN